MPTTTFERVTDDDAVEVQVDFTLRGGAEPSGMFGPPEHYDPGEAPEITIEGAEILATGEETTLTDAEVEKVETYILENLDQFDGGDDYYEDF